MTPNVETDELQSIRFLPEGLGLCPRNGPTTVVL